MRYKLTVYKNDSKGKERITNVEIFDNREDLYSFIDNIKSEIKPYKITDNNNYHIVSAL